MATRLADVRFYMVLVWFVVCSFLVASFWVAHTNTPFYGFKLSEIQSTLCFVVFQVCHVGLLPPLYPTALMLWLRSPRSAMAIALWLCCRRRKFLFYFDSFFTASP